MCTKHQTGNVLMMIDDVIDCAKCDVLDQAQG